MTFLFNLNINTYPYLAICSLCYKKMDTSRYPTLSSLIYEMEMKPIFKHAMIECIIILTVVFYVNQG